MLVALLAVQAVVRLLLGGCSSESYDMGMQHCCAFNVGWPWFT